MDIAEKKVELIGWLARLTDEELIGRIETLKKESIRALHRARTPQTAEDVQGKLDQAEKDIRDGRVHAQEDVEKYFNKRFKE